MLLAVISHAVGPGPTGPVTVNFSGGGNDFSGLYVVAGAVIAFLGVGITAWNQRRIEANRSAAEDRRRAAESAEVNKVAGRMILDEIRMSKAFFMSVKNDRLATVGESSIREFTPQEAWQKYAEVLARGSLPVWRTTSLAHRNIQLLRSQAIALPPEKSSSISGMHATAIEKIKEAETELMALLNLKPLATKDDPVPKPDENDRQELETAGGIDGPEPGAESDQERD